MSRLMSVAFTEDAVRARTKTVTRRKGWWTDKKGQRMRPMDDVTRIEWRYIDGPERAA